MEAVRQALLALAVLLLSAKLGGELMVRLGQPPVLGELAAGVFLGNLGLLGITGLEPLRHSEVLHLAGEIGAVLLLFEVGVESDLRELLSVGWSSLLVAALGVVAPLLLGYGVSMWLLPSAGWATHLFVGGTLTATSVGITARVLKDLGKSQTREARIVLGAAVADDVLGLVVLAVVSGLVVSTSAVVEWTGVLWIALKAVLFLVLAVFAGRYASPKVLRAASGLRSQGALLALCLCFCFLTASASAWAGLAPIVGAFAAGLVLDESYWKPFLDRGERPLEDLLAPVTSLVVPLFFVAMGLRVDLSSMASGGSLRFTAAITVAAILAKQVCGLGVLERGVNRLAIGAGMIPRGEVGLIFAGMGSTVMRNGAPVFAPDVFSALVVVVLATTFLTPPLLKAALERRERSC